jgi:hypothetical protein
MALFDPLRSNNLDDNKNNKKKSSLFFKYTQKQQQHTHTKNTIKTIKLYLYLYIHHRPIWFVSFTVRIEIPLKEFDATSSNLFLKFWGRSVHGLRNDSQVKRNWAGSLLLAG